MSKKGLKIPDMIILSGRIVIRRLTYLLHDVHPKMSKFDQFVQKTCSNIVQDVFKTSGFANFIRRMVIRSRKYPLGDVNLKHLTKLFKIVSKSVQNIK